MNKVEFFKNLMVMAAADRSFTQQEVEYLTQRANRLGLSEQEFGAAMSHAIDSKAELTFPPTHEDRVKLLKELIQVMAADGQLADVEKELFAVSAAKIGITGDELNRIIDAVV